MATCFLEQSWLHSPQEKLRMAKCVKLLALIANILVILNRR